MTIIIQKKKLRFVRRNAGANNILALEADDPKLSTMTLVLTELWSSARDRLLRAVEEHSGYEIHGAGFAYDGRGYVDIFRDDATAKVTEQFFEQVVKAYGREATTFSP